MYGHEYVKSSVLTYLESAVPARLSLLRTRLGVDTPVTPPTFTAADTLVGVTEYPAVLVRSTSVPAMLSEAPVVEAQTSSWVVRYDVQIVVAAETTTHNDYAGACADRDRLLLAVREAVLLAGDVGDDIDLVVRGASEDTGAAAESLRGAPLAVGSISLTAIVGEQLVPAWSGETWTATDQTFNAYSSGESIP